MQVKYGMGVQGTLSALQAMGAKLHHQVRPFPLQTLLSQRICEGTSSVLQAMSAHLHHRMKQFLHKFLVPYVMCKGTLNALQSMRVTLPRDS